MRRDAALVIFILIFTFIAGNSGKLYARIILGGGEDQSDPVVLKEEPSGLIFSEIDPVLGGKNLITVNSTDAILSPEPFFGSGADGFLIIGEESLEGVQSPSYALPPFSPGVSYSRRSEDIKYTVKPGDTLSAIAGDFGISVNSIIWSNNLKPYSKLYPGDMVIIPPANGLYYTVRKGDTLSGVAKRFAVKSQDIADFNGIEESKITIGKKLFVPNAKPGSSQQSSSFGSYASSVPSSGYAIASKLPDLGGFFIYPTTGWNWGVLHPTNGVDIANSCGTPIYAAADGLVVDAKLGGWNSGYGSYAKIQHFNGVVTLYAHMSSVSANAGASVKQGQVIGSMGRTGKATGCHLHFEVRGAKNPLAK